MYTAVDAQSDKLATVIAVSVNLGWQHLRRSTCPPLYATPLATSNKWLSECVDLYSA